MHIVKLGVPHLVVISHQVFIPYLVCVPPQIVYSSKSSRQWCRKYIHFYDYLLYRIAMNLMFVVLSEEILNLNNRNECYFILLSQLNRSTHFDYKTITLWIMGSCISRINKGGVKSLTPSTDDLVHFAFSARIKKNAMKTRTCLIPATMLISSFCILNCCVASSKHLHDFIFIWNELGSVAFIGSGWYSTIAIVILYWN